MIAVEDLTMVYGKRTALDQLHPGGVFGGIVDVDPTDDAVLYAGTEPVHLYRSEGVTNQSLRVKLVGTKSNRDGIGAVVRITAGSDKHWQMMKSGSSYLSQSELVLTFGMGSKTKADTVEVQWPSGQVEKLSNVAGGQTVTIEEGKGAISQRAYGKK